MKLRFKKYFAEILGTAMLVFVGCGTGISVGTDYKKGTGYILTALAFGLVFIALYYGLSHISGCHLNPAVSMAMVITREMSFTDFIGYTVAQFVGAFAGCGLVTFVHWGHTGKYLANTYYNAAFYSTFVIELIMTMILVSVFITTYKKQTKSAGILNGLSIILVYIFSIQFTGGSANPARTLATAVFAGGEYISQGWIIIAGAFAGALIAALLHLLFKENTNNEEISDANDDSVNKENESCTEEIEADETNDLSKEGEDQ